MSTYNIIPTASRTEWLQERKKVLTATEIAALYCGGPSEWARIRRDKESEPREIHSKFLAWGVKREPEICQYAKTFVDSSLEPNDQLLVSERWPRIGATPDMLGDEVIAEHKTSRHEVPDMSKGLLLSGMGLRYYIQVQVQLLVTGAEACVFCWEQHDSDWREREGNEFPEPMPLGIQHQIVKPDQLAFEKILDTVKKFDAGGDGSDNSQAAQVLRELHSIHATADRLKQRESALREELKELVGVGGRVNTQYGSVSYTQGKPRQTFDSKAFKAADPDTYSRFVVEKETSPSLRVTFAKEEN